MTVWAGIPGYSRVVLTCHKAKLVVPLSNIAGRMVWLLLLLRGLI